jgi:predicted nucleic acid-binding protein
LLNLYLDTSTIIKRYIIEPGTETADAIFDRAETGEITITFSLWNIGETLGVLDEKRRRKWLTEQEFKAALTNFAEESVKLIRLKTLQVTPILSPIITDTWNTLLKHHIYEADALQITTCKYNENDALISADKKLVETTRKTVLKAYHIVEDKQEIEKLI